MYIKKINEANNAIRTIYAEAIKDSKPVVIDWRNQMKNLEELCYSTMAIRGNIALDIVFSMALDDCLLDLGTDNFSIENPDTEIVLNNISKKVNEYILTCGADERNLGISSKKALYNLCKTGKARLITEYLDKVLSDIDEFISVLQE